jgi:LmbE family N-acetylglucosaminyl deacetylase
MSELKNNQRHEKVLVIGAHNDDYIIGAGGTLSKLFKEGKEIYSIIFSYGEQGLLQLKREISVQIRVKESQASDKIIGIKKTYYLGLYEGSFRDSVKKTEVWEGLKRIILELNPSKIFTHSNDDAHPDHRAVHDIVLEIVDDMKSSVEVYTFQVWNLFSFQRKNKPQLIVDITQTFQDKRLAFYAHKSQQMVLWILMWNVYLQAILNGKRHKIKYAEVFYRER